MKHKLKLLLLFITLGLAIALAQPLTNFIEEQTINNSLTYMITISTPNVWETDQNAYLNLRIEITPSQSWWIMPYNKTLKINEIWLGLGNGSHNIINTTTHIHLRPNVTISYVPPSPYETELDLLIPANSQHVTYVQDFRHNPDKWIEGIYFYMQGEATYLIEINKTFTQPVIFEEPSIGNITICLSGSVLFYRHLWQWIIALAFVIIAMRIVVKFSAWMHSRARMPHITQYCQDMGIRYLGFLLTQVRNQVFLMSSVVKIEILPSPPFP